MMSSCCCRFVRGFGIGLGTGPDIVLALLSQAVEHMLCAHRRTRRGLLGPGCAGSMTLWLGNSLYKRENVS